MTNETYTFIETNRDRKTTARSASHKKGGSKSKKCTLPSDHLTEAQKRKLNGPAETVNLNRPMAYAELSAVSPTLQFLYLDHLVHEFGARQQDIISMLGASGPTCYKLFRSLPGKLIFKGKPRKPDPRWLEFMQGELPAPAPEDPILPEEVLIPTPDQPEPEDPEPEDPDPEKPEFKPDPLNLLAGSFTVHGNLLDLAAAITRFIDNTDDIYTFTLSFTK